MFHLCHNFLKCVTFLPFYVIVSQHMAVYLVWNGGHWRNCLSTARVDQTLNGYLNVLFSKPRSLR